MYKEVLDDNASAIWEKCGFFSDDFYLAGGTALAFQMGHRKSIDLDFFSDDPIKNNLLKKIEENLGFPSNILKNSKDELTLIMRDVKLTFLHYPFPLLYPKISNQIISLSSVEDIASMKAYSLGRRRSLKDYIDLYFIFSANLHTFEHTIADAYKKYNDAFNDRLFSEQLITPEDLEDEPIMWLAEPVSKEAMKDFFAKLISEIKI